MVLKCNIFIRRLHQFFCNVSGFEIGCFHGGGGDDNDYDDDLGFGTK
jgi:hypothetical protein